MENNTSPIPIWVIVIIVIIVLSILLFAIFYTRKRSKRTRSNSIETIHRSIEEESEEKKTITKKSESLNSFQTLVHQQQKRVKDDFIPKVPSIIKREIIEEKKKSDIIINESDYVIHTPEQPEQQQQEIKISLPLPPPSTSFFSDKMELEDNQASQDLYQKYLKPNTTKEFVSIDVESTSSSSSHNNSSSTSFYAAAATNISQKAATIKSSLYQSFRLQQKPARATAQNMFAPVVSTPPSPTKVKQQQPSPPPPPTQEPIHYPTENPSQITMDSNKTIVHVREPSSFVDTKPMEDNSTILEEDDDMMNEQEPVRAAKRIIRSASRKTKTRSMVVNHDSLPAELQQFATVRVPKNNGSMRFGSIRGAPRTSGEHMTITSGSMRRMVRESVYFEDDQEIPSMPVVSAAAASTRTSSRKSGGVSAVDIAGWWGGSNATDQTKSTTKNNITATTAAAATLEEDLDDPLFKNVSAGSNSSNSPNQYRASLSTSIFGTMSKSNMALFIEQQGQQQQEQPMTRRESFRKGTLSRNTLRNLTAGAKDVNRSIKGLFDHASSGNNNSNKVVPDDSQKMELVDSDPPQEDDYRFQSIRQKSVRNTSGRNSRPSLPVTYIPESSPKYALGDEEEEPSPRVVSTSDSPAKKGKDLSKGTLGKSSHGEVDTIRRMLQDTWNMKESGSMFSISSEADSVVSSQPSQQNKSNAGGRHQSSSLLTKSLLTSQVAQRNSMLRNSTDDFLQQGGGPQPTASFSSSTARTMVLDETPTRQRNGGGSNKVQQQQQDDLFSSNNRFSTATMEALPRNSSADSSRGHSRKSSGGNSAATALRISSSGGYSVNARTWNGRANQKRQSRPSVTQVMDEQEQQAAADEEVEDEMPHMFESIGPNSTVNKRAFFSTMRKGQKSRGGIPWMDNKTPAQIERDRYLDGGKY